MIAKVMKDQLSKRFEHGLELLRLIKITFTPTARITQREAAGNTSGTKCIGVETVFIQC